MARRYERSVLDAALRALERELRSNDADAAYEFVVIGGSSLLLRGLGARATSDVDVLGAFDGSAVSPATPLPPVVVEAAVRVADQVGLDRGWFGDDRTIGVLQAPPPVGYEERLERYDVGPALTLWFPHRVDLIGFKLDAAANSGEQRSKHHEDLLTLVPTDAELLAATRWMQSLYVAGDAALADAERIVTWLRGLR